MSTAASFIEEMGPLFSPPRRHKRISLKKKVLLWPSRDRDRDAPAECVFSGWTETIGEGGLCIVTRMRLHVHQVLKVSLQAGEGRVPTSVEVKWINKKFDSWSTVGMKFII